MFGRCGCHVLAQQQRPWKSVLRPVTRESSKRRMIPSAPEKLACRPMLTKSGLEGWPSRSVLADFASFWGEGEGMEVAEVETFGGEHALCSAILPLSIQFFSPTFFLFIPLFPDFCRICVCIFCHQPSPPSYLCLHTTLTPQHTHTVVWRRPGHGLPAREGFSSCFSNAVH